MRQWGLNSPPSFSEGRAFKTKGVSEVEKVKLPREVAEAIEHCKQQHFSNRIILRIHLESDGPEARGVHNVALGSIETETLMEALLNGYEVEQTPGEKVQEYYHSLLDGITGRDVDREAYGVRTTLNLLGIKIDGVNA